MLLWSCSDKEPVDPIQPTPGAEVQFGAALDEAPTSRTIYGDEANNQFPILWLNGDQVKVMSPGCAVDQALYSVSLSNTTTDAEAGELKKVGDAGIQWGTDPAANFFSVYPAEHVTEMTPSTRTVKCHLIHNQNDYIHNDNGTYTALADMNAGFLYAATYSAENGKPVNLNYKPISTALRFTLRGPSSNNSDAAIISYIRITAPENQVIAGDFTLTFPDASGEPTITIPTSVDNSSAYNYITVFTSYEGNTGGGYLTLGHDQSMELNAFLLLDKEVTIDANWTIEVILSDGTVFKKALGGTTAVGQSATLVPGKIHRLPELPTLDIPEENYDPSNWMVNIPRNTYLSEISIPGSWNSMNSDFQSETDLVAQYNAGVRAFHLDCRWKDINTLGIAAGSASSVSGSGWDTAGGKNITNGQSFQEALNTIVNRVQPDEYLVVLCTFAQNSAVPTGKTWENAVSDACNNVTVTTGSGTIADATKISSTTTVGEVLNKVIVIVNTEGSIPSISGSKCFFVNAPLSLKQSMFGTGVYGHDLLHYGNEAADITFYTSQCQIQYEQHGFQEYYGSQGNDNSSRGYLPTAKQRLDQLNAIMSWSQNNYADKDNYTTTNWIYLGLGGYKGAYASLNADRAHAVSGSYTEIASTYNNWIYGKITNMSGTPTGNQTNYYPVGIVLMNFVTNSTYGTPVVNNILQLNNKYQKAYDKNKPAWPKGDGTKPADAPVTPVDTDHASGYNVDTNTWTVL